MRSGFHSFATGTTGARRAKEVDVQISRKMLIGLVLGAAVVGSIGSVAAQTGTPSESPSAETERAPDGEKGFRFHGGPGKHGKALRSTAVIEPEEEGGEFRTVQSYSGTLDAIDGNTLTIEMADGEKAEVTVNDDTEIRRDREAAELGELEVGDHVRTHQMKEGDGEFVTEHVGAISAEQYAEMEAQREVCEDDPSAENCGRRFHRFGPGMGRPGDEPATEESSAAA